MRIRVFSFFKMFTGCTVIPHWIFTVWACAVLCAAMTTYFSVVFTFTAHVMGCLIHVHVLKRREIPTTCLGVFTPSTCVRRNEVFAVVAVHLNIRYATKHNVPKQQIIPTQVTIVSPITFLWFYLQCS